MLSNHPSIKLKTLCTLVDHGIYTLPALACFMVIRPGMTQQEISSLSGQSDSSVSQWIAKFAFFELVDCEMAKRGSREVTVGISYTDLGQKLHDAVNTIFKHA